MERDCIKHGHYYVFQFETKKWLPNDPVAIAELIRTYKCGTCGHEKQTSSIVLRGI